MIQQNGRACGWVVLSALLLVLLSGLATPPVAAAAGHGIAYSVRSHSDHNLYAIDLTTGAATAIGPTGFQDIEGLSFDTKGVLYAYDSFTGQLLVCNLATGACTPVARTGIKVLSVGLTFDDRGDLYLSDNSPRVLYRIDPSTGAARGIAIQSQCVCGLAFYGGVMYGLGGDHSNNLVRIDRTSGAITVIGPLGAVSLSDGGIDFDGRGVLWALEEGGKLFTIDIASGAATVIGNVGPGFEGLAIPPNHDPDCSRAVPSIPLLWPPGHDLVGVNILGVTDPDGDPVAITIDGITQNEPVNGVGDGDTCPDAAIAGSTAQLRAERSGGGDGRAYVISFTATDGRGGQCSGRVAVFVPHDRKSTTVEIGSQTWNSLGPCPAGRTLDRMPVEPALRALAPAASVITLEYAMATDGEMQLAVYDLMGRRVAVVESGARVAGTHRASWNAAGMPSGMYFAVLRAGDRAVRTPVIVLR